MRVPPWSVMVVVVSLACSAPAPTPVCTPGRAEACVGPGGCQGGQRCTDDGLGFGACDCGSATGGGDGGAATGGGGGGSTGGGGGGGATGGGGGGAELDGGADAGVCDPLQGPGANGCPGAAKCTWVVDTEGPTTGRIACVPNGTVALGGACTRGAAGPASGYDNCASGTYCIGGRCEPVCDLAAAAPCGPTGSCTRYGGVFSDDNVEPAYGACNAKCLPLEQVLYDGGTCGAGRGCYVSSSSAGTETLCAIAGTVGVGQPITGIAWLNVCVPGAVARRAADGGMECGALCRPAPVTSTSNQASEGGVTPYTCQARGAPAPADALGESCRYWWARERGAVLTEWSNTLGFCVVHGATLYDSDGDMVADAPLPRCTTLTTGDVVTPLGPPADNDAQYFWCVEL